MINSKTFSRGLQSLKGARSPAIPLAACFIALGALLKDGRDSYFEYKRIVENESEDYINECLSELTESETKIVEALINTNKGR